MCTHVLPLAIPNGFGANIWAPCPLAIGPQLLVVHQAKDGERPESNVMSSPPATSLPAVYMEDAMCHWGVRLPSNR